LIDLYLQHLLLITQQINTSCALISQYFMCRPMKQKINSKGYWQYYIMPKTSGILNCVHHLAFWNRTQCFRNWITYILLWKQWQAVGFVWKIQSYWLDQWGEINGFQQLKICRYLPTHSCKNSNKSSFWNCVLCWEYEMIKKSKIILTPNWGYYFDMFPYNTIH